MRWVYCNQITCTSRVVLDVFFRYSFAEIFCRFIHRILNYTSTKHQNDLWRTTLDVTIDIPKCKKCSIHTKRCISWANLFHPQSPFLALKSSKFTTKKYKFKILLNDITMCVENEVCTLISMTCSMYRWITNDNEEKKGPKIQSFLPAIGQFKGVQHVT